MSFSIRADGAETLARTLSEAAAELGSGLGTVTAQEFRAAALPGAPRRTGQLAGSITVTGTTVQIGVVYGGPIVGGWRAHGIEPHPWFIELARAEQRWAQVMEDREVQPIVDQIRGT